MGGARRKFCSFLFIKLFGSFRYLKLKAEGARFELARPEDLVVFKTTALDQLCDPSNENHYNINMVF
jgi:hypothetical protein